MRSRARTHTRTPYTMPSMQFQVVFYVLFRQCHTAIPPMQRESVTHITTTPPPPPPSGRGMVMVIADCHTAYALLMHSTLPLRVCMLCHFKSQRREHCLLQQSQYLDCSLFTHQCSCVSYLFGLLVHQQRTDAPHSDGSDPSQ